MLIYKSFQILCPLGFSIRKLSYDEICFTSYIIAFIQWL